jgi:predicted ATPase
MQKCQLIFWEKFLWDGVFDRLFRVGPVRQRTPWYTGVGTRTSSEFGQGGENLVNVLGSKEKVRKTKSTLLDLVDSWLSSKLKVLKKLRMKDIDEAKTIRMLLGDEVHGPEGVNLAAMGEGVSQILPIIARSLLADEGECLIVEQPEIHLHPGLQADLADLFIDVTADTKRQIIVETHSEHLLLRIRRRIAEGVIKPEQVAIIYVEKDGPESTAKALDLKNNGHIDDWPKGFFEEGYQDAMAIVMASQKKRKSR